MLLNMDLLRKYNQISKSNNINVLGIDLVNETAEQWDYLKDRNFSTEPIRLMAWMPKDYWNPVLNHGTLLLGIVNSPFISGVSYRYNRKYIKAKLVDGYWRPSDLPIPLDALEKQLEVKINTKLEMFEIAWLIVNDGKDQQILASTDIKEIL